MILERERINTVETESEKREHVLSPREMSLKAKLAEFEDKLKRMGGGNIKTDYSLSDWIERKEKLNTASADFDRRGQRSSLIETSMTSKEMGLRQDLNIWKTKKGKEWMKVREKVEFGMIS